MATTQSKTRKSPTRVFNVRLDDGRHVQFFANLATNLVVVDVVDEDEKGGVEILRRHV